MLTFALMSNIATVLLAACGVLMTGSIAWVGLRTIQHGIAGMRHAKQWKQRVTYDVNMLVVGVLITLSDIVATSFIVAIVTGYIRL